MPATRLGRLAFFAGIGVTAAVLGGVPAARAEAGDNRETPSRMDPAVHGELVRASLGCAVSYLRSCLAQSNGWTFALQPITMSTGQTEDGQVTVTNRYSFRIVTNTMPERYTVKYETRTNYFETYEATVARKGASAQDADRLMKVKRERQISSPAEARDARSVRRVIQKVAVSREPVGSRTVIETNTYVDAKGTNLTVTTHPIMKPTYGDLWREGFLGQNAMVLLALLKCGEPETDADVRDLADSLRGAVMDYALPDTTVDLAWLAAAFANLSGEEYREARDALISKLLDGQIQDGPARGLWGPVCVNKALLAQVLEYYFTVSEYFKAKNERAARQHNADARLETLEQEAEAKMTEVAAIGRRVSQHGFRFGGVTTLYNLGAQRERDVIVDGLSHFFYNQTLADVESTALALYALREAQANGCLPKETERPGAKRAPGAYPGGLQEPHWLSPEPSQAVLARAAAALAARQKGDTWDEANTQQPCAAFAGKGQAGGLRRPVPESAAPTIAPLAPEELFPLASASNSVTAARGQAALLDIGRLVGFGTMSAKYGRALQAADAGRGQIARQALAGALPPPAFPDLLPYELYFRLRDIHLAPAPDEERDREPWRRLARDLIAVQNENGSWGAGRTAVRTTSEWMLMEYAARRQHEERQAKLPEASRTPFDAQAWREAATRKAPNALPFNARVGSTAYAVLFLIEGARPPAAAFVAAAGAPAPAPLTDALRQLRDQDGYPLSCTRVPPDAMAAVQGAPVVFLDATVPLDTAARAALRDYLAGDGTLILAGKAAAPDPTAAFLPLVAGGRAAPLPADTRFLQNLKGDRPAPPAILRPDGSVAVLCLAPAAGKSTPQALLQVAVLLLRERLKPVYGDKSYVTRATTSPDDLRNVFAIRADCLRRLAQGPAATPAATPAAGVKPASRAGSAAPAPKRVLQEDEKF